MLGFRSILFLCGITLTSVSARAANDIVVPRDFPTIQAAVDQAAPGATIRIRPGTYTEELVIAQDVTLVGSGIGKTIITSPLTLTPFGVDLRNDNPVVSVVLVTDGASVAMSRLTVTGPIPCDVTATGIRVIEGATLDLSNSHITRMQPEDPACPADSTTIGQGVVIGLPGFIVIDGQGGSVARGTIRRIKVDRYLANSIIVVGPPGGPPSTAAVLRNTVIGGTNRPVAGQSGIFVAVAAVARVTGNIVRGNVCTADVCGPDPTVDFQSSGISVTLAPTGTVISHNSVFDNDIRIYQVSSADCCTIRKNRLRDNHLFGIAIQDGDGATSKNFIKSGEVGIGVIAGFGSVLRVYSDRYRRVDAQPPPRFGTNGPERGFPGYQLPRADFAPLERARQG